MCFWVSSFLFGLGCLRSAETGYDAVTAVSIVAATGDGGTIMGEIGISRSA